LLVSSENAIIKLGHFDLGQEFFTLTKVKKIKSTTTDIILLNHHDDHAERNGG
jgi:hypothetical protein